MGLGIVGGACQAKQFVDLAPRVALSESSAHGNQPIPPFAWQRNLLTWPVAELRVPVATIALCWFAGSPGPMSKQLALHAELSFVLPRSWPSHLRRTKAHIVREWIYSVSEFRCFLNASQAVSLPSHLTCTVVGVAKSQMNLLFNRRT